MKQRIEWTKSKDECCQHCEFWDAHRPNWMLGDCTRNLITTDGYEWCSGFDRRDERKVTVHMK